MTAGRAVVCAVLTKDSLKAGQSASLQSGLVGFNSLPLAPCDVHVDEDWLGQLASVTVQGTSSWHVLRTESVSRLLRCRRRHRQHRGQSECKALLSAELVLSLRTDNA